MSNGPSGPGGGEGGGAQDPVSHHTWHPPTSPAPARQTPRAAAGIEGAAGSRSLENSPEGTSRPRASKKSAFNMKVKVYTFVVVVQKCSMLRVSLLLLLPGFGERRPL